MCAATSLAGKGESKLYCLGQPRAGWRIGLHDQEKLLDSPYLILLYITLLRKVGTNLFYLSNYMAISHAIFTGSEKTK